MLGVGAAVVRTLRLRAADFQPRPVVGGVFYKFKSEPRSPFSTSTRASAADRRSAYSDSDGARWIVSEGFDPDAAENASRRVGASTPTGCLQQASDWLVGERGRLPSVPLGPRARRFELRSPAECWRESQ